MKTPFRLCKTPPGPAAALLLAGDDAAALLRLCAALGPALPTVHRVRGGFLVRLPPGRENDAFAGVVRLRALSANLFVPVDAALRPALLEDEARALVRQRGLVFLPAPARLLDGEERCCVVLEFAPAALLSADELLEVPLRPGRGWRPLPARAERPAGLHEVLLDVPDPPPEAIVAAGGEGIGVEAPRPPAAGPGATLSAGAMSALGHALVGLGRRLGLRGLAGLGAGLIARAVEQAPRLSEGLLGRQEAALRELLRQFREGNVEDALRRALPLNPDAGRGAAPAQDADLPTHNLSYRLGDLLVGGRGSGSVWMAAGDVYHDLESAYRRAAEEAVRRGDHRRAAFIYGKLLQDWRQAAGVLMRGGLYHDAAVLYLEKLGDRSLAARAFEAAGEVDRALQLYRQAGEHVPAGDLLARAGEAERALAEYTLAADAEAAAGRCLAAGELMLHKAQRSDLAEGYLAAGWAKRPGGEAPGCLLRLTELYALRPTPAALLALVGEADAYLAGVGQHALAASFYNRLVVLSGDAHLAAVRDELQDRALLGLAGQVRQAAGYGKRAGVISQLFGGAGVWPAALVRDAESALGARPRPEPAGRSGVRRLKTHAGRVTAACAAQETGDLFIGFADGVVAHLDPRSGAVTTWQAGPGEVVDLAVDRGGESLVVCRAALPGKFEVVAFQGRGRERHASTAVEAAAPPRLTPVAHGPAGGLVGLFDGRDLLFVGVPDLVVLDRLTPAAFAAALILEGWPPTYPLGTTVIFDEDALGHTLETPAPLSAAGAGLRRVRVKLPSFATAGPLRPDAGPLFSWLAPGRTQLEAAYADEAGVLHWLRLRVLAEDPGVLAHYQTGGDRYLCAALVQPGRVAGVRRDGLAWLGCGGLDFLVRSHTRADLAGAAACFASPQTGEVLVVLAGGDVVRAAAPW